MGIDYYGVLRLTKHSHDLDIKQAYRRIAIETNPRRADDAQEGDFALACEAYEVLANPLTRAVYDQYGEEGLKRGVPGPKGFIEPYTYHGDPLRTYKNFFGTESPFADLLHWYHHPLPLYDLPEGKGLRTKQATLVKPLALTLEEVYQGCLKKMRVQRRMFTDNEQRTTAVRESILDVPIKPGLPAKTEILYKEAGDQGPTIIPADIVLLTEDRPHPTFTREGVNLKMVVRQMLKEALAGTVVVVTTLDGRTLRVPITQVASPSYVKVVPGEGMPYVDDNEKKGDLIISFEVTFPRYLPQSTKKSISKALTEARMGGDEGSADRINRMVLMDKMRRVNPGDRLPH